MIFGDQWHILSLTLQSGTWNVMGLFPGKFGRTDFHQRSFLGDSLKWWPWVRWNQTGMFHKPPGVPFGGRDSRLGFVFCFLFSPVAISSRISYHITTWFHIWAFLSLQLIMILWAKGFWLHLRENRNRLGITCVISSIRKSNFIYFISFYS